MQQDLEKAPPLPRRGMLKMLAAAGAALGVAPLLPAVTRKEPAGSHVDFNLLAEVRGWVKPAYSELRHGVGVMPSAILQIASAYTTATLHLHSNGMDSWAVHRYSAPTIQHALSRIVARTGARISEEDLYHYSRKVASVDLAPIKHIIAQGDAVSFHRGMGDVMRNIAYGGPGIRDVRRFNERTCFYLDWGTAYLSVVALPLAESPIGWTLGLVSLGGWAVSKIGGC